MKNSNNLHITLKNLRKQHNLSQIDVANYLNVTRQAISNWETGKTSPDINTLVSLCKLYNTSLDELCSNDFSQKSSPDSNAIPNHQKMLQNLELIGIAIFLILSTQFPFLPLISSIYFIRRIFKRDKKSNVMLVFCIACFLIGLYNTYIFVSHFIPLNDISTIEQIK